MQFWFRFSERVRFPRLHRVKTALGKATKSVSQSTQRSLVHCQLLFLSSALFFFFYLWIYYILLVRSLRMCVDFVCAPTNSTHITNKMQNTHSANATYLHRVRIKTIKIINIHEHDQTNGIRKWNTRGLVCECRILLSSFSSFFRSVSRRVQREKTINWRNINTINV